MRVMDSNGLDISGADNVLFARNPMQRQANGRKVVPVSYPLEFEDIWAHFIFITKFVPEKLNRILFNPLSNLQDLSAFRD